MTRSDSADPGSPEPSSRRLRADARTNQDRLLEAATALLARPGADTTLKAIARQAGVGIATLYRRFPTRESLIEAVYRNETAILAGSAAALLAESAPREALRSWFRAFLDYMDTKQGMSEALPAILGSQEGLRMQSRDVLCGAIDSILHAGAADRSLRTDLSAYDVMMAIGGIALITAHENDHALGGRLTDLLVDGLAAR